MLSSKFDPCRVRKAKKNNYVILKRRARGLRKDKLTISGCLATCSFNFPRVPENIKKKIR